MLPPIEPKLLEVVTSYSTSPEQVLPPQGAEDSSDTDDDPSLAEEDLEPSLNQPAVAVMPREAGPTALELRKVESATPPQDPAAIKGRRLNSKFCILS